MEAQGNIDIIEEKISEVASMAFQTARDKTLKRGIAVQESVKGHIIETSPSGETRVIKPVRPHITVSKGNILKIRKHK